MKTKQKNKHRNVKQRKQAERYVRIKMTHYIDNNTKMKEDL